MGKKKKKKNNTRKTDPRTKFQSLNQASKACLVLKVKMPKAQQVAPWVFYGSLGLIVLIPFLFRTTATFIVGIIGFIYPTFASVVAIQKGDQKVGQWLVYWVVYFFLTIFQRVFEVFLSKIPLYPLFNALFLIALMHYPFGDQDTLAQYLYYKYFAPNFGKAAIDANDALMEAAGEIKNDPQGFAGSLINGNDNRESTDSSYVRVAGNCGGKSAEASEAENLVDQMMRELEDEAEKTAGKVAEEIQPILGEGIDGPTGPGQLSQLIRASVNDDDDENNNHEFAQDTENAARMNQYKSAYPMNFEKLVESREVLTLTPSTDEVEVDVDVDLLDDGPNEDKKEL